MLWLNRQLRTADLIDLCRALRYSLSGGMRVTDAIDLLAREGTPAVRRATASLTTDLKAGWSLHEAMDKQGTVFPPLFRALATVGEETGNLPEVMAELEKYYTTQQKLRRDFISDITWPLTQFIASVLIIAGLIFILGYLPSTNASGKPVDALGLGLLGSKGAVRFLSFVCAGVFAAFLLVRLFSFLAGRFPFLQRLVFRIPVLGSCLRALALNRLCIALRLMLDTRMSVLKAIHLAFVATDNAAFRRAAPEVEGAIRRGNTIADSFEKSAVIPAPFKSAIAVAEESGRLPEMCAVQAENYDEQARRKLATLNRFAGTLIWLVVATFIIVAIFRIANEVWLKPLNNVIDDPTGLKNQELPRQFQNEKK